MTTTKDNVAIIEDDEANIENNVSPPRKKYYFPSLHWKLEGFNIFILSVVIFTLATTLALIISVFVGEPQVTEHGAVSSISKICSQMGVDLIKNKKANAVDATISTHLCLSLTRPDVASMFGCGAVLVHDRSGDPQPTTRFFDFSCSAPKAYDASKISTSTSGLKLTGVNYVIHALYELHVELGSLPWSDYFEPVFKLIDSGFEIDPELKALAKSLKIDNFLTSNTKQYNPPKSVRAFYEGIEKLEKPYGFYNAHGPSIEAMMVEAKLGWNHKSEYENLTFSGSSLDSVSIAGFNLLTFPAPFMGGMFTNSILNNLNTMFTRKPLDSKKLAANDPQETAKYLNRLAILSRYAESLVSNSGDPKDPAVKQKVDENTARVLSAEFNNPNLDQITDDILKTGDFGNFDGLPLAVKNEASNLGDSFILVTDSKRYTVLTSLYMGAPFGNAVEYGASGQFLNAALDLFSSSKNDLNLNKIAPGRRPLVPTGPVYLHSQAKKCGIRFGVGSSGGFWGLFDAVQVLTNAIFFLDGASCTQQKATAPAKTLVISANPEDSTKTADRPSALNFNCLPAEKALGIPRVHVYMNESKMEQTVEPTISSGLKTALIDLKWTPSNPSSWLGRVAITGWNGYNLIAYGDPRSSVDLVTPF